MRRFRFFRSLCVLAVVMSSARTVSGTVYHWNNPAGGSWLVAANWSPVGIPSTAADSALIDLPGTYTVTQGSGTIGSFSIGTSGGPQTLNIDNTTITINAASSINAGGIINLLASPSNSSNLVHIDGPGDLAIASGGVLNWADGRIGGPGTLTISAGGMLNYTGNFNNYLTRNLNNSGTVVINSAFSITLCAGSGTLINNNGLIDLKANAAFGQLGGCAGVSGQPNAVNNNSGAMIRKSAGTGTSDFGNLILNNNSAGLIDARVGTIAVGVGTGTGQFNALAGANVDFGVDAVNAYVINAGATFTGAGSFRANPGLITINVPVTIPNFVIGPTSGTLGGPADLTVTGTFNWLTGSMTGSGAVIIPTAATLNIAFTGVNGSTTTRSINNSGTVNWTGTSVALNSGAVFTNSGTFDMKSDATVVGGVSPGTFFNNSGLVKKSAGTGLSRFNVAVNNTGTIQALSGKIEVDAGVATGALSGTAIEFGVGSSILRPVLNQGTTLTGTGKFDANFGGVTVNGNVSAPQFDFVNGILDGSGTLTITGSSLLQGASMSGTGTTSIASTAIVTNSGLGLTLNDTRMLNNAGTINWTGTSSIFFNGSAVINNNGVFDAQGDGGVSGSGTFNNSGTFKKSGGSGTTNLFLSVGFNNGFNNSGTLLAQSGTIRSVYALTQTAGTTSLAGGALNVPNGLIIQGGLLNGNGTITGDVTNGGTVGPGLSAGALSISGNYTQNSTGTLAIEIGGTTAGTQFDQLNVTGTATLGGTLALSLISPFSPAVGNSFMVMTFASHGTSDFGRITGVSIGGGKSLQVATNATNVTINTTNLPSGDANGDGVVTVADVFYLINFLFTGGSAPVGPADANGDGQVTVTDVFYLINYLFAGGPAPR